MPAITRSNSSRRVIVSNVARFECVEMNVDAPQTRVVQDFGLGCKQDAVGRESNVVESVRNRSDPFDQSREILANQRFAARQANLVDAQIAHHADNPLNLFEAQDLFARPESYVLGHAVDSTGYCSGP